MPYLARSAVVLFKPTLSTTAEQPQLWKVFDLYGMSVLRCVSISMQVSILLDKGCILIFPSSLGTRYNIKDGQHSRKPPLD